MKYQTDEELYATVGANIKHYRKEAKITQVELCKKCNISLSYLSKIEAPNCNKSVSLALLNEISNILGIEISKLFERNN